jgi:hypothetical protein
LPDLLGRFSGFDFEDPDNAGVGVGGVHIRAVVREGMSRLFCKRRTGGVVANEA